MDLFRRRIQAARIFALEEPSRAMPQYIASLVRGRLTLLDEIRIAPQSPIALVVRDPIELLVDLCILWEGNRAPLLLPPDLGAAERDGIIDRLRPSHVLDGPSLEVAADPDHDPVWPAHDTVGRLDRPALILLTSGSTGHPVGVVHSFRGLLARIALNLAYIPRTTLDRTLCFLPLHFGHGLIGNLLTPLFAGADVFLSRLPTMQLFSHISEVVDRHKISFFSSVPSCWSLMTRMAPPPTPGLLRRVHIGSAPLHASLWREAIRWTGTSDVVNAYGITEAANWISGASATEHTPESGLVGRPWGGTVAVRRDDGRIDDEGDGEIVVSSPALASRLLGKDERQDDTLPTHGWLETGDIGNIDGEGNIRLQGRSAMQIKTWGMRIHPEEIDLALSDHPNVEDVCAFGVPHDSAGEVVGVMVVLREDRAPLRRELKAWAAARLQPAKRPSRWFFHDRIPRSNRGKLQRDRAGDLCLHPAAFRAT